MRTMQQALVDIADSIFRRNGSFAVTIAPSNGEAANPFSLMVGSWRAVKINGGFIVSLGLSREQIQSLRDDCNALLGEDKK